MKNKEYLDQLTPILGPLLNEVVKSKPDDPLPFMLNWLKENYSKLSINIPLSSISNNQPIKEVPDLTPTENLNENSDDDNSPFLVLLISIEIEG